jgi:hypothetical protein
MRQLRSELSRKRNHEGKTGLSNTTKVLHKKSIHRQKGLINKTICFRTVTPNFSFAVFGKQLSSSGPPNIKVGTNNIIINSII